MESSLTKTDPIPKEANVVSVNVEPKPALTLSEEEAFALLSMCMLTTMTLDPTSERALRKLADYCKNEQLFDGQTNGTTPRP
jgi:hypothetical protein